MRTKSQSILVLNAGSSSLKFSVYDASDTTLSLIAGGQIEGLGNTPRLQARDSDGTLLVDAALPSAAGHGHDEAFAYLARWLHEQYDKRTTVAAVGHRITHGGPDFTSPALITPEVLERLEALSPLAPLHQPHNLSGVRSVAGQEPNLPQIACFDTSFHRNRAAVTERFGLPADLYPRELKRWGFHGLSYESISGQFMRLAPHVACGRVIVAHLGNGASLCAMKAGRSVDTTMSFSTLDGLAMGTRCGSLDPGVVLFLQHHLTASELDDLLYNRSGLLGISGISSDMRVLLASKDPRAAAAVEFFVYRVVREIGSLTAALGGLDALIFTAGIGENSAEIRARICKGSAWLGMTIDPAANERREPCISPPGRVPSVWVLRTDEEGVIAAHTRELASKLPRRFASRKGGRYDRAGLHS
jgi:acetate kinase